MQREGRRSPRQNASLHKTWTPVGLRSVDTLPWLCYCHRPFSRNFGVFVANTRSAEKQNRQSQKHRVRNAHVLSTLRTSVRKFREAAASGDPAKTTLELAAA